MKSSPDYKLNLEEQTVLSPEDLTRINEIEQMAIAKFIGDLRELETALGMLKLGYQYGWKVLVLVHSKKTIKKYEAILGILVREEFPEEGPSSDRSLAYTFTKKIGNFWKVVSGDVKVPNKSNTTK